MRKKIKVSVPKLVKDILTLDLEAFNVKLEKLCNIIIQEMGYDSFLPLHEKMKNEKTTILSFNLNKKNSQFLSDMIKNSSEDLESEFFRSLFSSYSNLHPTLREKLIKKNTYLEIELSIKFKLPLKISFKEQILDIKPLKFTRNSPFDYNLVECLNLNNNTILILELRFIEILNTKL